MAGLLGKKFPAPVGAFPMPAQPALTATYRDECAQSLTSRAIARPMAPFYIAGS